LLVPQSSGTDASLRGVSAVNDRVAWASGTNGTVLRTTDGGGSWQVLKVSEGLDFRGVHAIDEKTAWILSSGPGDKSRMYKTVDAGAQWVAQYTNADPKGFFDAIAFWDETHGIVLGDPVDGEFVIMTTDDGGATWARQTGPPALPNEGAFAASNTCLLVRGKKTVWFGTGGGRVFRSDDRGRAWTVAATPIRHDSASAGVFSLAFSDAQHGIAVGGDYSMPNDNTANIAITSDGGRSWLAPSGMRPNGYRSAIVYLPRRHAWIATGTNGSDISMDNGMNWKAFDSGSYNALSGVWAVGPKGRIARLQTEKDDVHQH
jgi:photosystem II stability/assembly factor-like uncharacterized protein